MSLEMEEEKKTKPETKPKTFDCGESKFAVIMIDLFKKLPIFTQLNFVEDNYFYMKHTDYVYCKEYLSKRIMRKSPSIKHVKKTKEETEEVYF